MPQIGARHHASHEDGGNDEIEATGLTGRADYVDRGDPATADLIQSSMDTDGAWHDWDLSAIVPAGTKLVHLRVYILDDFVGAQLLFRENGNTNTVNVFEIGNTVANLYMFADGFVVPDANRVIEYAATNMTWTAISITVAGWFI